LWIDQITVLANATIAQQALDESWGVTDVSVSPVSLSVPGTPRPIRTPERSNFAIAPFDGWGATSPATVPCSDAVMLRVTGNDNTGGAAMAVRTYTGLPTHNAVQVTFRVYPFHKAGNLAISLAMDSRLQLTQDVAAQTICAQDTVTSFEITTLHSASTVALAFSGFKRDAGSELAAFGVFDVVVSPQTLGIAQWTDDVTDFRTGLNGWIGSSIERTTCSTLGVILGGHTVFGAGAFVQKTFTNVGRAANPPQNVY
jgi:hypothetical protein